MSDLDAFRAETRTWLAENCPAGVRDLPLGEESMCWGGRKWRFRDEDQRLWFERMRDRGWTVPTWPVEYGGGGLDRQRARILQQEMRRIGAASPLDSLGIWMLGPALLKFGSEHQKKIHLPRIARGEIRWAQGYSEPNAGSDLASVQTRGEDMGDHFLVNGSKLWTSYGDKCDMIFALVRTEPDAPKHLGISFLLIDMDDPGVTTKPIRLIAGDSPFTATFFDNVRAPKENVVGERGRGWEVTKYLLGHEREMIGSGMSSAVIEPLAAMAKRRLGAEGIAREPSLRDAVIRHEIDAWAIGIAVERNRDQAKAGTMSPVAPSMLKLFGTELHYRRTELAMSLAGAEGFDAHGAMAHDWLHAPANCIAGGSNEIQLNIIAKRALGLPGKLTMALVLSDDEQMLVSSLRTLLARADPIATLRRLRDSGDLTRHAPELWRDIAEAGFSAPQVPEAAGGVGMGYVAAGLVAQELGRTLAPAPIISTAVVIELLLRAGDAGQQARWLPGLIDGSTVAALAIDEGGRHDPDRNDTVARRDGARRSLSGAKRFVVDGGVADVLVVAAREGDRRALFLVDPAAQGVQITPLDLVDSRNAADIGFADVGLASDSELAGDADAALERALDVGRALLAAELLGLAEAAFDRTVSYLAEREQFGVKIGSFQALQHRAARAYVGIELMRGVVLKALRALDEDDAAARPLASLAKAFVAATARDVLREAVQMHGGVGVTDEFDIGLFFKRARVAGDTYGDEHFHRERLARIAWQI